MILEFSIQNYRSFKEKTTFSMVAEASKAKADNVFEQELTNGDSVRLLKTAVIYGPNASGKSNLLKALSTLKGMVRSLARAGEPIRYYDPFLFDTHAIEASTVFELSFIGPSDHKYIYNLEYNGYEILNENLDYYPKSQKRNLFKRSKEIASQEIIHIAKLGKEHGNKPLKVLNNQTVLSKFGTDEPDEFFTPLYLYFQNNLTAIGNSDLSRSTSLVEEKIDQSPDLMHRLNKLIRVADTRIDGIIVKKNEDDDSFINERDKIMYRRRGRAYESFGKHSVYNDNRKINEAELPFNQESKGTNVLFVLGALILEKLEKGGIFLVDEIDTSLHPKLAKFLVMLFQNPRSNPKNAQLIFTTHETTFLDKDIFRKDQIWFVEKNEFGESDLISVQDFEGVREDTPFEKWYLAGKFGGIPNIQEIEFIYQDE